MIQCTFYNCTREYGHEGPHGIEVQPGLIIAPYGTGKEIHTQEYTNIPCNTQCGSTLVLTARSEPAGGMLKCPKCGQTLTFHENGQYSETICPRLYGPMKKTDTIWREYLDHKEYITRFEISCYKLFNVPESLWRENLDDYLAQIADAKDVYDSLAKKETLIDKIKEWLGVRT